MQDRQIKIGIWQDRGSTGDVEANVKAITGAVRDARKDSIDLLVFPECFLTGYHQSPKQVHATLNKVSEKTLLDLAGLAEKTGIALVVGSYEKAQKGIFNSAHFFSPGASTWITYRKRALYGDWEKSLFERGSGPVLFDYMGFCFGMLICFDIEFPELVRELAHAGADIALVPTALMAPYENVARVMVPARAMENGIHVVYANRVGTEGKLSYVGQSCIADPMGNAQHHPGGKGLLSETIFSRSLKQNDRRIIDYAGELPSLDIKHLGSEPR